MDRQPTMNQQQAPTQVEYTNTLLDRLVEHYLTATTPDQTERDRLTPVLFHKLYRAIMAEGYGQ